MHLVADKTEHVYDLIIFIRVECFETTKFTIVESRDLLRRLQTKCDVLIFNFKNSR